MNSIHLDLKIIKSPSDGVKEILRRRIDPALKDSLEECDAIGLIQGKLIDMVFAVDLAEKKSGVVAADVRGNCPQNVVMTAIFGDTSSVEAAIAGIKEWMSEASNDNR